MSIVEMAEGRLESRSEAETMKLGTRMGANIESGEALLLVGSLGTGKTRLTKGIADGLGIAGNARVRSPSFSLVNVYSGTPALYHADLYRLSEEEIPELAMEEIWDGQGVLVIEWAERLPSSLRPPVCLWVRLEHTGELETRRISWGQVLPPPTPGCW